MNNLRHTAVRRWRPGVLLPLLSLGVLVLLLSILAAPGSAQAADQLWFKSAEGEWAVTSGVADDDIGKVNARGVPKRYIRYSIEGADGFSIGRRSGRVSYDGTAISGGQVSLAVTARDKNGEAASASRIIEVSVTQPTPPPAEDEQESAPQQEPDNVAPTVSGLEIVSTPKAHDSYAAGETITVEATFSEPVIVTGSPCLLITVGQVHTGLRKRPDVDKQQRPAAYVSGSGTSKLSFSYTVVMGDRARKGIGVFHHGHRALRLQCSEGGADATIRDAADNDAVLYHSWLLRDPKHMVGGPDVYPDDRTGPTITGLEVLSGPRSGDTYRDGETILVGLTFSEPVTVSNDTPFLGIWMGKYRKELTYREGSGSNRLTLGYRVQSRDRDGDGISTEANMVLVYDGDLSVTDSADNPAKAAREAPCPTCWTTLEHGPLPTQPGHKVAGSAADTTPPAIREVSIGSRSGPVYISGEVIHLDIYFSEIVELGGVKPSMEFTIGGKTRTAAHVPGSSPSHLMHFAYTVQEGDAGDVAVPANGVRPADAVLRDSHDNLTASLAHPALDDTGRTVPGAYIVDRKLAITSTPAEGDTYRAGETITISATFNTNVTVTGTPSIGTVYLRTGQHEPVKLLYSGGSGTNTLTFSHVVGSRDSGSVRGLQTDGQIQLDGGATIKDADGNDAYLAHHPLGPLPGHQVDGGG